MQRLVERNARKNGNSYQLLHLLRTPLPGLWYISTLSQNTPVLLSACFRALCLFTNNDEAHPERSWSPRSLQFDGCL